MFKDPFAFLAIFDDLHNTRDDFKSIESSITERAKSVEQSADRVDEAVQRWHSGLKELGTQIGRDVHDNGYVALEKYVDDIHERAITDLRQITTSALTAIDQTIAKAVADLNQDAIWAERAKRLGEEVHFNGYAALATLVDDTTKTQEERFSKVLLDSVSQVEELIDNLAAAVVGKPPLPIMPHDASMGRKIVIVVKRTFVRCRRWCIDATAPALIVIAVLLLVLVLQNCFWHYATR